MIKFVVNQEKPNVLILGASGGVGGMVFKYLQSLNTYNLTGTYYQHEKTGLIPCDICKSDSLEEVIDKNKPQTILDFAGISNETACKNDPELARETNVGGVQNIINLVSERKIPFLFPGTINEFSGYTNGTICTENTPLLAKVGSIYGETKIAAGKIVVQNCTSPYTILRTDLILGEKNGIVGLFEKNQSAQIRINTIRFPAYLEHYSKYIQAFIAGQLENKGIYHVVSPEFISGIPLVNLAELIIKRFNLADSSKIIYNATELIPRSPGQAMPIYVDSKANELATENRIFTSLRHSL